MCNIIILLVKLLDITYASDVNEGEYANFSCTGSKGWILWRVGDYTDEGGTTVYNLDNVGLSAAVYSDNVRELHEGNVDGGTTIMIGILATAEMNGVPVQCVIQPYHRQSAKEYSMFATIKIHHITNDDDDDDGDDENKLP